MTNGNQVWLLYEDYLVYCPFIDKHVDINVKEENKYGSQMKNTWNIVKIIDVYNLNFLTKLLQELLT